MLELVVLSTAFAVGAAIPDRYACGNRSPDLSWGAVPAGTQSLTVLCDDPDAPAGDWVHWVVFNLAPDTRFIPENVTRDAQLPGNAIQGVNDYRRNGYDGPCPPIGQNHRYFFKVFALDTRLALDTTVRKPDLLRAMHGHILAQGSLWGTYARKSP